MSDEIPPIQHVAQMDTPQAVTVPNSLTGLIVWATGRFGIGILMALAFGYATREVYMDMKTLTDRMITAFEQRAKVDTEIALAMKAQTDATNNVAAMIQSLREDVKNHRNGG
jgi:hypothetical protein